MQVDLDCVSQLCRSNDSTNTFINSSFGKPLDSL